MSKYIFDYVYVSKLVCPALIISSSVDSSYSGMYKLDKADCGNIFINNVTSKVWYIAHAHMHTLVYTQIKENLGNFNSEAKMFTMITCSRNTFNEAKTILDYFPYKHGTCACELAKIVFT